ncbi:hypothetical protein PTH_2266 [Pelotomaculum thermopropionicum SI]|uniref:Uncharacterized protein n=1 Tax=Pelotomaculum thermopropionicum (strain DSM 13744 / JCM 10971 / SI) TaxID=370438 RepID=A5CZY4_PELTS|nr:hypothetical protein PTH_2266 [Pelotomaculum thermopropionicum SI]
MLNLPPSPVWRPQIGSAFKPATAGKGKFTLSNWIFQLTGRRGGQGYYF